MRFLVAMVLACSCSAVPAPSCPPLDGAAFWPPMRRQVDLLVVVGNAPTEEEHARRAAALTRLTEIYATGDRDGDGALDSPEDFDPVDDLHLWVISSHLGSGGTESFLALRNDRGESSAAFVDAFESLLRYEPSGEIEQPLEAALRALSSGANDGFAREHSYLQIVVATASDDCSVSDERLFTLEAPYESASLEVACPAYESEALFPVQRYVDGLLAQRSRPGLLSFAPIVGIPEDLAPGPGESADFDALVSEDLAVRDDRMEPTVDPLDPTRLSPACESSIGARAIPAVRIARVARELERQAASVTIGSVCSDSYEAVLPDISLLRSWRTACRESPVPLRADGGAACTIDLVMPPGFACDDTPGTVSRDSTEDGRAICTWTQLVPSAEDRALDRRPPGFGWFFDDYSAERLRECRDLFGPAESYQRLVFNTPATPGAEAYLRCDGDPPSTDSCG